MGTAFLCRGRGDEDVLEALEVVPLAQQVKHTGNRRIVHFKRVNLGGVII